MNPNPRFRPSEPRSGRETRRVYEKFTAQARKIKQASQRGTATRATKVREVRASTGLLTTDGVLRVLDTSSARNVDLPDARKLRHERFRIEDGSGAAGTNAITLRPVAGQTVNGASTYDIDANYAGVAIRSDGANWIVE